MSELQITTELVVSDEKALMQRVYYDDVWEARKKMKDLWGTKLNKFDGSVQSYH